MIVWSPVGAGEGCECGVIKPAVKHIQITSQLRVLHGVGGGFPIVGDVLLASPHWRRVVSWKPVFLLFRVASLCYSDLGISQCVSGLVVQDPVPTPVGLLFGLTKLPELCCESRFIVIKGAERFGGYTHAFTKTNVGCHSVSEFFQGCRCSLKNTPVSPGL